MITQEKWEKLHERMEKLNISEADLSEQLASDAAYQTLIRNAYSHLLGSPEGKTHEEMAAALAEEGLFVGDDAMPAIRADRETVEGAITNARQNAMATVAILPIFMAVCYLGFILYFRSKGGYTVVELPSADAASEAEIPADADSKSPETA